jgi:Na+-translocating ferredoxin:NAD+ oxidoreductase subunit G
MRDAENLTAKEANPPPNPPPNPRHVAFRTAGVLLAFTLAFTALMAGTHNATAPLLARSAQQETLRLINEVLPPARYDNALLQDRLTLPPNPATQSALGIDDASTIYRARLAGAPAALVIPFAAPDGYAGRIALLMAVDVDGRVLALRVTSHRETPGLGDYIDPKKDRNKTHPWIAQFDHVGFTERPPAQWRVKKEGGAIDQMSGATLTARAVSNASRRALEWVLPRRNALFAQAAGGEYVESP